MKPEADLVLRPAHYTSDPSGVECITVTRHRNFNIGNAIKYLWRAGRKHSSIQCGEIKVTEVSAHTEVQDLNKAIFYINDEIKRLGGECKYTEKA